MSAVIDKNAYTRIKSFINLAKSGIEGTQLVFGGKCDEAKGYFIEPTCIRVKNFKSRLLTNVFLIAYKNIHLSHFRTKSRKYLAQFWMYMFTMIKNAKQFLILLKMPLHMVIFFWTVFSSLWPFEFRTHRCDFCTRQVSFNFSPAINLAFFQRLYKTCNRRFAGCCWEFLHKCTYFKNPWYFLKFFV